MTGPGLTAIVLTGNEAQRIAACLEALRWVDEIIVVDSGSTDGTVDIARRYAHRVEVWAPYPGYARQRNRALALATKAWVFCVDADEICPPALGGEIREVIAHPDTADAYALPLRNHLFGRWMRSRYWWPHYHVRLFRRGAVRWEEREVHPPVMVSGRQDHLMEPLDHFSYPDLRSCWVKMRRYTAWEARERVKQGLRPPGWRLAVSCLKPAVQFWRRYVLLGGYRDGWEGLLASLVFCPYSLLADWKTWRLSRAVHGAPPSG